MKKCVYCGKEIDSTSVVDVCYVCGESVWGKKMFQAIIDNMGEARDKGDLFQGSVTDTKEDLNA
jgi:uncharacterized UBP type Zn finger protein